MKPKSPFWDRNSSPKAQKRIAQIAQLVGANQKALQILFNGSFDLDDPMIHWIA